MHSANFCFFLKEVNFGIFDCTNGNILQGLEFFLSQIMIPALKSQQVTK